MIRILFFLLFSLSNLYSQTTKIILVDYLNNDPDDEMMLNAIMRESAGVQKRFQTETNWTAFEKQFSKTMAIYV